jgi:hypothetical protein
MENCPQINNTTIKGTSVISYDSTPLPCTDVKQCDGLNDILTKFDTIICNVTNNVNILVEEVTNITEDLMIISENIIDINTQLNICCPTTTTTTTTIPPTTTTTTTNVNCYIYELEAVINNASWVALTCEATPTGGTLVGIGDTFITPCIQSASLILNGIIATTDFNKCNPTTTTTSTSSSTTTTSSSSTTTTTTTINPFFEVTQLIRCTNCPGQPVTANALIPVGEFIPGEVIKTSEGFCWTVGTSIIGSPTVVALWAPGAIISCAICTASGCPDLDTCNEYQFENNEIGTTPEISYIDCDGVTQTHVATFGTSFVCGRKINNITPQDSIIYIQNKGTAGCL